MKNLFEDDERAKKFVFSLQKICIVALVIAVLIALIYYGSMIFIDFKANLPYYSIMGKSMIIAIISAALTTFSLLGFHMAKALHEDQNVWY